MSVSYGPPTPPQPDKTYSEAIQEAQRDFARLMHLHDINWQVDVSCTSVWMRCSCDDKARNVTAMRDHILKVVHDARGPRERKR